MGQLIPEEHRDFAETIKKLLDSNPFLPERIQYEREALGERYQEMAQSWNVFAMEPSEDPNIEQLQLRSSEVLEACLERVLSGDVTDVTESDALVYVNLTMMHMYYHGFRDALGDMIEEAYAAGYSDRSVPFYREYKQLYDRYLGPISEHLHPAYTAEHIFAYGFQVRRAYFFIYRFIVGTSSLATQLRARVWESIFTHNLERYQKVLYQNMHEFISLINSCMF